MSKNHGENANGRDDHNVIDLRAKRRQQTLDRAKKVSSEGKKSAPKGRLALYIQFAFFLALLAYFLKECH